MAQTAFGRHSSNSSDLAQHTRFDGQLSLSTAIVEDEHKELPWTLIYPIKINLSYKIPIIYPTSSKKNTCVVKFLKD